MAEHFPEAAPCESQAAHRAPQSIDSVCDDGAARPAPEHNMTMMVNSWRKAVSMYGASGCDSTRRRRSVCARDGGTGRGPRHEATGLQTGCSHTCQGVPPCVTHQAIPATYVDIAQRMLFLLQDGVSILARASAILELDQ